MVDDMDAEDPCGVSLVHNHPACDGCHDIGAPKDFAAAWASKCEELARETATVTALRAVLREVLESRGTVPFDAERYGEALRLGWAVLDVEKARQDEDFMARLAALSGAFDRERDDRG